MTKRGLAFALKDFSDLNELKSEIDILYTRKFTIFMLSISVLSIPAGIIFQSKYLIWMETIFALMYGINIFIPIKENFLAFRKTTAYLFELHLLASSMYLTSTAQIELYTIYYSPVFILYIIIPILAGVFRLSIIKHLLFIIIQIAIIQKQHFFSEFFSIEPLNPNHYPTVILLLIIYSMILSLVLVTWIQAKGELINKYENDQKNIFKELNESKSKLFSIISHDLKNPISTIIGFADLLQNQHHNADKSEKYAKIILSSAKKQSDLINDLLTWSRSQLKQISQNNSNFNLDELTNKIVVNSKEWVQLKNITIKTHLNSKCKIWADKDQVQTIIRNLLNNAIKFTPPGGEISINSSCSEKFVTLSITDTGIGMDEKTLKKIFNNQNFESTIGTSFEQGTGLGINICQEFVQNHGGKIWAESKLEKGSTFYFTLPLSSPKE